MAISTGIPECPTFLLNGGYNVHPVPTPVCTILLIINKKRAGIKNQNLILFSRGKAISGDITINGNNQFPNPPIKTGITIKKIITKA